MVRTILRRDGPSATVAHVSQPTQLCYMERFKDADMEIGASPSVATDPILPAAQPSSGRLQRVCANATIERAT